MATTYYGGEGSPDYNEGNFIVKYSARDSAGQITEIRRQFFRYDEAEDFYNSIDNSAALWNMTTGADLCEAKTSTSPRRS